MKVAIGVAAAVMMFAASAAAQTSTPAAPPAANANCSGFVTPPTFPDGATANARQMTAGNEAYQTWGSQRVARLTACRADIEAMRAAIEAALAPVGRKTRAIVNYDAFEIAGDMRDAYADFVAEMETKHYHCVSRYTTAPSCASS